MFIDTRNRLIIAALWILLAASFVQNPALGQTPTVKQGEQFLVNTSTPNDQQLPRIGMGSGGEFVVVWSPNSSSGDPDFSVYGRVYDALGQPLGSDFRVNSYTTSNQYDADVAVDEDGGFVVVWLSVGSDNGDSDLHSVQGQRFAADGLAIGSQFLVNTYTTGLQIQPSIAMSDAGSFVVVWTSTESDSDPSLGIEGRRFAPNGDPLGAQFGVNTYTTSGQSSPAIAMDGEGDFVVSWLSFGSDSTDTSGSSIQARLFASSGSPVGDQFQVNTYTLGGQAEPAMAVDFAGNFVIAWQTDGGENGDPAGIQAQRFSSAGTPLGQQFLVNTYTPDLQIFPSVGIDRDGGFVATWRSFASDNGDTSSQSVQGRRFAEDGTPVGDQFLVNTYTTGGQANNDVVLDQNGDFLVVWESTDADNGDPGSGSIQGQKFRVTADVGDRVFRDENLDGLQTPGEPGVEGIPVHLFESDGDLLDSTVTDADGAYLFQPKIALQGVADEYFVRYQATAALQFTAANVGGDDTVDSDAEPITGETDDFVVQSAGEDRTDLDAGLADGIGNWVWYDLDGNGIQDGGEPGAAGVLVELFDFGGLVASTTTSDAGYYGFPDVVSGTYQLVLSAPEGYVFTKDHQGADPTVDSDVFHGTNATFFFDFTAGTLQTSKDAGLIPNVSEIGDRIWLDADTGGAPNGIQDGGEVGAPGVTVNLYRVPDPPDPEGIATLEGTAVTDADGFYSFTVEPGTFFLELVCPIGSFTGQDQGGDDSLDSDVNPASGATSSFELFLGTPDVTRDAGLLDPDGDGVATCVDNCPSNPDPDQTDSDGDGSGDPCDLCAGDDAGGDVDGDGSCAGSPYECDDMDPTNACAPVFDDGFESGDTSAWSTTVN